MKKDKKKNILVIGASGFVGKALLKKLISKNANIFIVSRDRNFNVPLGNMLYGDVCDEIFCKKILQNVDVVYYLASYKKNIAAHTSVPFDVLHGNVTPFLSFLRCAKESSLEQIIYVSSSLVEYATSKDAQIDGYVFGKYINEIIVKNFYAQTKIPVKIVRSCAVYGPGNDFDPSTANLIPSLITKVSESTGEVVLWGKGIRKLQFVYIDDLVKNLVVVMSSNKTFFSIGNSEVFTVKQVLQKVIKHMKKNLKIVHDLTKPDKETQLSKFSNIIKPKVSLEIGILNTILHYKKNA